MEAADEADELVTVPANEGTEMELSTESNEGAKERPASCCSSASWCLIALNICLIELRLLFIALYVELTS